MPCIWIVNSKKDSIYLTLSTYKHLNRLLLVFCCAPFFVSCGGGTVTTLPEHHHPTLTSLFHTNHLLLEALSNRPPTASLILKLQLLKILVLLIHQILGEMLPVP